MHLHIAFDAIYTSWKVQNYIVVLLSDHSCALTLSNHYSLTLNGTSEETESGFFRTENGWADTFSSLSLQIPLWIFSVVVTDVPEKGNLSCGLAGG